MSRRVHLYFYVTRLTVILDWSDQVVKEEDPTAKHLPTVLKYSKTGKTWQVKILLMPVIGNTHH